LQKRKCEDGKKKQERKRVRTASGHFRISLEERKYHHIVHSVFAFFPFFAVPLCDDTVQSSKESTHTHTHTRFTALKSLQNSIREKKNSEKKRHQALDENHTVSKKGEVQTLVKE
jgi:hypothetical protein